MNTILSTHESIRLEEMKKVRLMNRVDTKYVTTFPLLISILQQAKDSYFAQEIDGEYLMIHKMYYPKSLRKDLLFYVCNDQCQHLFLDIPFGERKDKGGICSRIICHLRHHPVSHGVDVCTRNDLSVCHHRRICHHKEQYVPKFDEDGITPKDDEWGESKGKHILRSRLEVEYNIRKSKFEPFASYEIYNSLSDGFAVDKALYTMGTDYKFNKKHSVSLFYRYIDKTDEDEASGHVIGIGYKFKL